MFTLSACSLVHSPSASTGRLVCCAVLCCACSCVCVCLCGVPFGDVSSVEFQQHALVRRRTQLAVSLPPPPSLYCRTCSACVPREAALFLAHFLISPPPLYGALARSLSPSSSCPLVWCSLSVSAVLRRCSAPPSPLSLPLSSTRCSVSFPFLRLVFRPLCIPARRPCALSSLFLHPLVVHVGCDACCGGGGSPSPRFPSLPLLSLERRRCSSTLASAQLQSFAVHAASSFFPCIHCLVVVPILHQCISAGWTASAPVLSCCSFRVLQQRLRAHPETERQQ